MNARVMRRGRPKDSMHAYHPDLLERSILAWDALRQCANNMLEFKRAGTPPLRDFKVETLLDARRFNQSTEAGRSRDALSESAFRLFYDREAQT